MKVLNKWPQKDIFTMKKVIGIVMLAVTLLSTSYGETKIYLSNNHSIISLEEAYQRLMSTSEIELEQNTIPTLQIHHVEQGQFQEALGVYQMASSQENTADNSAIFDFSPYQTIKKSQLNLIAQELAEKFDQESVAITNLNPNGQEIIDRVVSFNDDKPFLTDVILKIKAQLPLDYQIAYTLHIDGTPKSYDQAQVSKIEWIGRNLSTQALQAVFNQASIQESKGSAWLVYKDGSVQNL